jgi:hypothetical protein
LNLVEEAIVAEHGDDTRDSLLDPSGLDGAHTSLHHPGNSPGKVHAGSAPPDFWFDAPIGDVLVVHYRSVRRLGALAEGMMAGAAAHNNEQVSIAHESRMFDGAEHRTLRVTVEEG